MWVKVFSMSEDNTCTAEPILEEYRFQNHWSDGNHNAKVRTVN